SQVTSAMPSVSVSSRKCWKGMIIAPSRRVGKAKRAHHKHVGTARSAPLPTLQNIVVSPLRPRIGPAVLVQVTAAPLVALGAHVDIRIGRDLARRAAADLEIDGVAICTVDQAMAVGDASLPAGGVAGAQDGLAVVLDEHELAFEHVHELVLV